MTAKSPQAAVSNGRAVHYYDTGMCQKFVRGQCWEVPSLYGSAIEAWNGSRQKHPGDRSPPLGAPLYYRGGNYGHAVIWVASDMRSTDCPSTGRVSEAAIAWVENNWGYEYLGWTGDINGVDLPLGGDGDEMNEADWDKMRKIVHDEVQKVWDEKIEVTKPSGDKEEKRASQIIKETWQKIAKAD